MYQKLQSWRAVGNALGVSVSVAWRYANTDYEPKTKELRKRLGLPIKEVIVLEVQRDEKGRFR